MSNYLSVDSLHGLILERGYLAYFMLLIVAGKGIFYQGFVRLGCKQADYRHNDKAGQHGNRS